MVPHRPFRVTPSSAVPRSTAGYRSRAPMFLSVESVLADWISLRRSTIVITTWGYVANRIATTRRNCVAAGRASLPCARSVEGVTLGGPIL
jgi:hypothetical protein